MRGIRGAHRQPIAERSVAFIDVLGDARVPALVASSAHHPLSSASATPVASELNGDRIVAVAAGRFVANAPGFDARLERSVTSVR